MDEPACKAFRAYVVGRSAALLRTAYLLTGNRADAEDLLQPALAKTYLSWDRIRDREAVDGYVRRVMVNTQSSFWRRNRPEVSYDVVPDLTPGRDATADSYLHDALWTAMAGLPRKQRGVHVLAVLVPGADGNHLVVGPEPGTVGLRYAATRGGAFSDVDVHGQADGVGQVDRARTATSDYLRLVNAAGQVTQNLEVPTLLCLTLPC